jgi:hypothetical protein
MTVEELRERLRYVTPSAWYGVIDEIISASHAEGVEEERERILAECGSVYSSRTHMEQSGDEFKEGDVWYYFPASVLAPKEKP